MRNKSKIYLGLAVALAGCATPMVSPPSQGAPEQAASYSLLAVAKLPVTAVTVDSTAAGFNKASIIDGNLATHWDNGGFKNKTATATVDLGATATLANVAIKTGAARAGSGFDVAVSTDGVTFTNKFTNQPGTSFATSTKVFPAGTAGRFVLSSTGTLC